MRTLFIALVSLFVSLLAFEMNVSALNSSLKQRILPLNCVYQIVNDGTGTIIYLTPQECGVLPDTPPPAPTPDPDPEGPARPVVVTITDTGTQIFQTPFVPVPNASSDTAVVQGTQYLPYQPITEVKAAQTAQAEVITPFNAIPIPVAVAGIAALILLILLFIL